MSSLMFNFWCDFDNGKNFAAIETCRQQLSETTTDHNLHGQSDCSEHTSSHVFEEFIPMKRASPDSDGEEEEEEEDSKNNESVKKSDWLRSVQLWNQTPDPSSKEVSFFLGISPLCYVGFCEFG